MRLLFRLFLTCAALLCLPLLSQAQNFQEGQHYRVLPEAVATSSGDKIEVVEIFWYGCPHCFSLEPIVDQWLQNKPEDVAFVRIPAVLGPRWETGARAFYVAEALGVSEQIHAPLFDAIHIQKQRMQSKEDLAEFFAQHGISEEDFNEAYGSFEVETKLRRAQELVRQYRVEGVPTIIVNGKYVTSGSMAGSNAAIFQVVDELIARERG